MYNRDRDRSIRELELFLDIPAGSHWGDGGTGFPDERDLWSKTKTDKVPPPTPEEVAAYVSWDEEQGFVSTSVMGPHCLVKYDPQSGKYIPGREVIPSWCKPEEV